MSCSVTTCSLPSTSLALGVGRVQRGLVALAMACSLGVAQSPAGEDSEPSSPPAAVGSDSFRLVDQLPAPLAHLEVTARTASESTALLELLESHALDSLLTAWEDVGSAAETTAKSSPIRDRLALVRRFFSRSDGALELALTGFMRTRADQAPIPMLVFRGVLAQSDAENLATMLEAGQLARRGQTIAEHTIWELRQAGSSRARTDGTVLLLAGRELLITNHRGTLVQLLEQQDAPTQALQPGDAEVLAGRPGYRKLRGTLTNRPGSLVMWADPARLQLRLPRFIQDLLPRGAMSWLGVADGADVMASVESVRGELQTTLLTVAETRDGMLALASSSKAKSLAPGLPGRGMGSVVWAWKPQSLQQTSLPLVSAMRERFAGGCDVAGLDLDKQVLRRLGTRSAFRGWIANSEAGPVPVLSVQAKDRRSAQMLFQDLTRAADELGFGKVEDMRRGGSLLELFNVCGRGQSLACTVMDGSLVFAHESYAEAVVQDLRRDGGVAKRKRSSILPWLQALEIENEEVAGLFDLDLTNTLDSFCKASEIDVDSSTLPLRHVGYVQMQEDGTVRLRLLSRKGE